MIFYCSTRQHQYTIRRFLSGWGADLAPYVHVVPYDHLLSRHSINTGVYIFSDLERLSHADLLDLEAYWTALSAGSALVFNHPAKTLKRYPLLRTLYEKGINSTNIYTLDETRIAIRYPVFVRQANEHDGALTELIYTQDGVNDAIDRLSTQFPPEALVIVEYIDYRRDDGKYYKYSTFRIGDQLIPNTMVVGEQWMLKTDAYLDEQVAKQELDFLNSNCCFDELMAVFDLAHVDYGRIDFAFAGERLHIFEINTNPDLGLRKEPDHLRYQAYRISRSRVEEALRLLYSRSLLPQTKISVPQRSWLGFLLRKLMGSIRPLKELGAKVKRRVKMSVSRRTFI